MQKGVSFENVLSRFRTSYYKLPIEVGGKISIKRIEYVICGRVELEDEYHYLFECTAITMTDSGGFLTNADVDHIR